MKLFVTNRRIREQRGARQAGSVLVIVLWVAFGLVALAVYFAHSMTFELRAADNRVAGLEAEQAIAGAARFVSNILATAQYPGLPPYMEAYQCEAVPVGEATFWFMGRDPAQSVPDRPYFYLVDEASKLDVNASWVTADVLALLPRMTSDLAANIITWRESTNETSSTSGATDQTYTQLNPAYHLKGGPFESIDELRLVYGATLDILYGEDANQNGVLDADEPEDNRNNQLDPGILEYLTVHSQDSNWSIVFTNKVPVTDPTALQTLLEQALGASRAEEIITTVGTTSATNSLLEFYMASGMTADEFALIEGDITLSSTPTNGLVNVNTASEAVLVCIPGIGTDYASAMVVFRQTNPARLNSIAWVAEVLPEENWPIAGPLITSRSYQYTADIAALGHHDRGYRRVKFIFDTSEGMPRIIYRQDLTRLGWALGQEVRKDMQLTQQTR